LIEEVGEGRADGDVFLEGQRGAIETLTMEEGV